MKIPFYIPIILSILALGAGLRPVGAASARPLGEEKSALSVTTLHPVRESWPRTLTVGGGIHPWQEVVVASEIGGLAITALRVDVGSVVKQGEELLQLSDVTVRMTLAQKQAQLVRARAVWGMARADGDRARSVKVSGAVSEQKITQYLMGEQTAQADLDAAQAALDLEKERLRQTRILAVDQGVIASRSASLGAVVQVGSELFRMVRQGRLEWWAELTAEQMTLVKPGLPASLTLGNGQTATARLRLVAPTLDPKTRKGLAYFELPQDTPAKAGMFAQGEIETGEGMALTLPQSAMVYNDGHGYLLILSAPDRVARIRVETGRRLGQRIEILSGLEENAAVVATGGAFLKDGDRVKLLESPQ